MLGTALDRMPAPPTAARAILDSLRDTHGDEAPFLVLSALNHTRLGDRAAGLLELQAALRIDPDHRRAARLMTEWSSRE